MNWHLPANKKKQKTSKITVSMSMFPQIRDHFEQLAINGKR